MNDYNNLPSASSQAAAPMPFDMGLPPLNQSFSLGQGHKKLKRARRSTSAKSYKSRRHSFCGSPMSWDGFGRRTICCAGCPS